MVADILITDAVMLWFSVIQDVRSTLESGANSRGHLSPAQISSLIDDRLVNDLQSKINSANFDVAFYIAESVIDKIVELLNEKYEELLAAVSDLMLPIGHAYKT